MCDIYLVAFNTKDFLEWKIWKRRKEIGEKNTF